MHISSLFTKSLEERFSNQVIYKDQRDEIVSKFVDAINKERIGTPYKPVTKRGIAMRLRLNPFLSKDDGACWDLLRDCEKVGNYKKFWYMTK